MALAGGLMPASTRTRPSVSYSLIRRTWVGLQEPRQLVHDGTALRPARQIGA